MNRFHALFGLVAVICSTVLFSACSDLSGPGVSQQIKDTNVKLEQRIAALEARTDNLNRQVVRLQMSQNPYASVLIDVSSPGGYQRVDTTAGFFLIALRDAKPYLDGYKLFLNIGNPSSVTYSGFALHVTWGWGDQQEKDFSFTQDLGPASWNKVELVIAPAKTEDLKLLSVSMTTDRVLLYTR